MKKLIFIFLITIPFCKAADIQNKEVLLLNSNEIATIPTNLYLPHLKLLCLKESAHNQMTAIPQLNAPNLQQLSLLNVQITTIPDSLFANLEELDLSKNRLNNIPYLNLPFLKELVLSNNQISTIPSDLPPLLIMLCLTNNKLNDISANLTLADLEVLHLNKNKIEEIPAGLRLSSLEWVNLSENQISSVDPYRILEQFPALTHIDLNKNPLDPDKVDEFRKIAAAKRPDLEIIVDDIGEQYRDGINIKG